MPAHNVHTLLFHFPLERVFFTFVLSLFLLTPSRGAVFLHGNRLFSAFVSLVRLHVLTIVKL